MTKTPGEQQTTPNDFREKIAIKNSIFRKVFKDRRDKNLVHKLLISSELYRGADKIY